MNDVSWDDFRIAHQVAISGTLSEAGKVLSLNHATVLRRINRLEESLSLKLFIRHQRGYKLTDAGQLLMDELPTITEQFSRLQNMMSSLENDIEGDLRITTVNDYPSSLNIALKAFRESYPNLRIQIIATDDIISLASGSVHVSLRMGPQPTEADLIAHKIYTGEFGYFAAPAYVSLYGLPKDASEYHQHYWVMPTGNKQEIPLIKAILGQISSKQLAYQSNSFLDVYSAVHTGIGIGPIPSHILDNYPGLHPLQLDVPRSEECLWFTYHKDLKNSAKVQALYRFLLRQLEK